MQKADAGSLIGVVSSTILSALSFIYNLGVLQLLFPYLAGAFTTYFVQHRLQMETEKREIERKNYELMRERIYGPTLKYVNILINNLVRIEKYFNIDKNKIIKEVLSDHLFFACNKQFRDKLSEIIDRFDKYQNIHSAAVNRLCEILRGKTQQFFKVDEHNPADSFIIRLEIANSMFSYLLLLDAIFLEVNPREFVASETEKWGPAFQFNINFRPKEMASIDEIEAFYNLVLKQTKEESLFVEDRNQRLQLLRNLEIFSENLKPHINLQ